MRKGRGKRFGLRRAVLWGAPWALGLLAAALFVLRTVALRTSLDDLVGDGVEAVPASVRRASADLVPVLVWSGADPAAAARALRAQLPPDKLVADVRAGRGVFVLSSHCGTVEALAALEGCAFTFHAWMDFDRTGVFNRFYLRHANRAKVVIHPISEIGMATAFLAGEALDRGDCLVMAGDRGRGAFRFAHALGHPAYFVACVWTGRGYRAVVRRLPDGAKAMAAAYDAALEELVRAVPDQWFAWGA